MVHPAALAGEAEEEGSTCKRVTSPEQAPSVSPAVVSLVEGRLYFIESAMGSFCVVVNPKRKEWMNPWCFMVSAKIRFCYDVDDHGANHLYHAIAHLCSGTPHKDWIAGQWSGDEIIFADDQNKAKEGKDYGVPIDPPDCDNLYDLARSNFRNISKDVILDISRGDPMFLISLFRKATSLCESNTASTWGSEILELYDDETDDGEWLRDHLERAAGYRLNWSKDQWDSLIARLRDCHAKVEEWRSVIRARYPLY